MSEVSTKYPATSPILEKNIESGESWGDLKIYSEVAKAASRKLPANGITVESLNLKRSDLFSAVASAWKSSMGRANTSRLEQELVDRLDKALDTFTSDTAQKLLKVVSSYSKRSQVDYRNRMLHWKLTMSGKEMMDLKEQALHCTFHITERERRLKDLLAKPGDWIEQIKDCEKQLVELKVITESIDQKIKSLSEVAK